MQVANVQLRIFIDDTIVWQVACKLLEKTLRYGLEHSIGNPHTEFGFRNERVALANILQQWERVAL